MFFLLRRLWLLIALGLAFLVPYGLFGEAPKAMLAKARSMFQSAPRSDLETTATGSSTLTSARLAESRLPVPQKLAQIFSFNWTPDSVLSVWPSATRVFEDEFAGLRVPLVTGTSPQDLAGSLTYYFDRKNQLRRIGFEGVTGDARPLVQLMVGQYQLRAQRSLLAGLYVSSWNGTPRSVLRLTYPPTIDASQARSRLSVAIELNRPAPHYRLSDRYARLLDQDKASGRWSGW